MDRDKLEFVIEAKSNKRLMKFLKSTERIKGKIRLMFLNLSLCKGNQFSISWKWWIRTKNKFDLEQIKKWDIIFSRSNYKKN